MKDTIIGNILVRGLNYMKTIYNKTNMNTWIDLQIRLRKNETIDKIYKNKFSKKKFIGNKFL